MPTETYDGIILGSGHHSLVLHAYLGKAGLKTLCIERRDTAGRGLTTHEDPHHPGFLHNTHSFVENGKVTLHPHAIPARHRGIKIPQ